jgi:hypothetical protein
MDRNTFKILLAKKMGRGEPASGFSIQQEGGGFRFEMANQNSSKISLLKLWTNSYVTFVP